MSYIFNFGVPGFMDALSPEQQKLVEDAGSIRRYSHKQHLQSRGDQDQAFSIIKAGSVCFGKTDSSGKFIALATLEAGQCYGEFTVFAGLPRTHDGFTVGETVISHISKARFDRLLLDHPDLAGAIIRVQTLRLHQALEWIDDLRRYPLKYRLGKYLLFILASADGPRIAITQSDLADLMGVSRVAVSGVLADYRARGFLRPVYGGLEILDSEGLRKWLRSFLTLDPLVAH
ncbi:MAG: Crp/Fnr family transcriptional regulator [Alphaproteobacteria bacterium]|nr:Crp/Fnr family transcriptional regulator [Alphaproteobacteria bacterium]